MVQKWCALVAAALLADAAARELCLPSNGPAATGVASGASELLDTSEYLADLAAITINKCGALDSCVLRVHCLHVDCRRMRVRSCTGAMQRYAVRLSLLAVRALRVARRTLGGAAQPGQGRTILQGSLAAAGQLAGFLCRQVQLGGGRRLPQRLEVLFQEQQVQAQADEAQGAPSLCAALQVRALVCSAVAAWLHAVRCQARRLVLAGMCW